MEASQFPTHNCSFCSRHYPAGETSFLFAGDGDCKVAKKTRSKRKGGDCPYFLPVDEKVVCTSSFYEVLYRHCEGCYTVSLEDPSYSEPLLEIHSDSFFGAFGRFDLYLSEVEHYVQECLCQMKEGRQNSIGKIKASVGVQVCDPTAKWDASSSFSRRFRLMVRFYKKPVMMNFTPKIYGVRRDARKMIPVRIIHDGETSGDVRMMVAGGGRDSYVRISDFWKCGEYGMDCIDYLIAEFQEHAMLLADFRKKIRRESDLDGVSRRNR